MPPVPCDGSTDRRGVGVDHRQPFPEAVAGLMVCAVFAFSLVFADISIGVVRLYSHRAGAVPDAALRAVEEQTRATTTPPEESA